MFSPRLKKLTTIILLAYGLAACSRPSGPSAAPTLEATSTPEAPTATPVPAAATVNGEIVPLAEYQAELARYQSAQAALGKSVGEADAAQAVLDDMIAQTLLAQGARAAGLSVTEAGLQSRIDALAASLGGSSPGSTRWRRRSAGRINSRPGSLRTDTTRFRSAPR